MGRMIWAIWAGPRNAWLVRDAVRNTTTLKPLILLGWSAMSSMSSTPKRLVTEQQTVNEGDQWANNTRTQPYKKTWRIAESRGPRTTPTKQGVLALRVADHFWVLPPTDATRGALSRDSFRFSKNFQKENPSEPR